MRQPSENRKLSAIYQPGTKVPTDISHNIAADTVNLSSNQRHISFNNEQTTATKFTYFTTQQLTPSY